MARGFIITLAYLALLGISLFIPAGDLRWPMGWLAFGTYTGASLLSLALADRQLVRERSRMKVGITLRDPILAAISFVFMLPLTMAVAGMDVMRCGWSPSYHLAWQAIALGVCAIGNGISLWAVLSNRYFSTFLRIQTDRDHQVVTHGPYQYVRHPGYAGMIMAALALPLALGSLWALIPSLAGSLGFCLRTAYEDATLMQELPDYADYARRVRHRLIPGFW
jgi:protein-S-isoprenylcysteine O-methyltransferase Ste14